MHKRFNKIVFVLSMVGLHKTYAMHMTTFPQATDMQECVFSSFSFKERLVFRSVCKQWNDVIEGKNKTGNNRTDIGICLQVLRNPDYKIYLGFLGLKDPNKAKNEARVLLSAMYDKKYDLVEALIQGKQLPIEYQLPDSTGMYNPLDFAYRLKDPTMIALLKKHGYRSNFYKDEEEEIPAYYSNVIYTKLPINPLLFKLIVLPFLIKKGEITSILDDFVNNNKSLIKSNRGVIEWTDEADDVIQASLLLAIEYESLDGILLLKKYIDLCPLRRPLLLYYIEIACDTKRMNIFTELLSFISDINIVYENKDMPENKKTLLDIITDYGCWKNNLEYCQQALGILRSIGAKSYKELIENEKNNKDTNPKLLYFVFGSAILASFAFLVKHLYQRTA